MRGQRAIGMRRLGLNWVQQSHIRKGKNERTAGARAVALIILVCVFAKFYGSCGIRPQAKLGSLNSSQSGSHLCGRPLAVAAALQPNLGCYQVQGKVFDTVYSLDNSRKLTPWIPCNDVQLVSMASNDLFDFASAMNWVATKPVFDPQQIKDLFRGGEFAQGGAEAGVPNHQTASQLQCPATLSPNHRAMIKLIRSARKSIFFNAIIFGGSWGSELLREMLLRNQRDGVEIVILRDTENSFAFASELVPVWTALQEFGFKTDGVTVVRSNIRSRQISGVPFGMDRITSLFSRFAKEGISLSGKSDHTKLLVIDGFESEPAMFVSSKNPSDYNLLNYDESVIVRGPAAAAAQAAYIPDLKLAHEQALNEAKRDPSRRELSAEDRELLKRWFDKDSQVRSLDPATQILFKPAGQASVRILENNGDDSVRNAELGVLQLLASAQKSIRIYNFLTYNPRMARAIALAAVRLGPGNVRVLADATLTFGLNITFEKMLRDELAALGSKVQLDDILKWRVTAAPQVFKSEPDRIGITQQQHTKSIIVDETRLLVGSTNFDFASMAGAFREFSVVIDEPLSTLVTPGVAGVEVKAQLQSARIFDSVWNDTAETMNSEAIKKSGGPTAARVPSASVQQTLINIMRTEQDRLGALQPENIDSPGACEGTLQP